MKKLILGSLVMAGLYFSLPWVFAAPALAPAKLLVLDSLGVVCTVGPIDDGCATDASVFDGTIDYAGTSGLTHTVHDPRDTTRTISGSAALAAWQGTGTVDLEVTAEYLNNNSMEVGCGASSQMFASGYSLTITYLPTTGDPVVYYRQAHPSTDWTWDASVPQFDGALASVHIYLEALNRSTFGVERIYITCGSCWGQATTDMRTVLWRL